MFNRIREHLLQRKLKKRLRAFRVAMVEDMLWLGISPGPLMNFADDELLELTTKWANVIGNTLRASLPTIEQVAEGLKVLSKGESWSKR